MIQTVTTAVSKSRTGRPDAYADAASRQTNGRTVLSIKNHNEEEEEEVDQQCPRSNVFNGSDGPSYSRCQAVIVMTRVQKCDLSTGNSMYIFMGWTGLTNPILDPGPGTEIVYPNGSD